MVARGDDRQFSLDGYFEVPRQTETSPGAFGLSLELRNWLSRAIKESPMSRAELAARMTDMIYGEAGDGEVTKSMIDSWTRSSGAWKFPLEALPAFLEATGAYWLLDKIAERAGCRVLVGEQAVLAELGAILMQTRRLNDRAAAIKKSLPNGIVDDLVKRASEA